MNNLVVDIGNSFTKLAFFNNRKIVEVQKLTTINKGVLESVIAQWEIENSIISTVGGEIAELEAVLNKNTNYIRFNANLPLRIINRYKTPDTLGLDRLAGVVAAEAIFPDQNCLVIDAGTCITYDFIDGNKNYLGGSISPGIAMRFRAMSTFTERLPSIEFDPAFSESYGVDTKTAILSGAQTGALYEAMGFITSYHARFSDIQVILCGGDINFFDRHLKNSIFAHFIEAEPQLVLKGLNEVIHQQIN